MAKSMACTSSWYVANTGECVCLASFVRVQVQIRDENHRPLPGIELGDVGPKLGDAANDTSFMRLENVRIPRAHMLCRFSRVSKDGKYHKPKSATNDKLHYATMMQARGHMVRLAGGKLAQAVTIAVRYSAVRQQVRGGGKQVCVCVRSLSGWWAGQGFLDTSSGASYRSKERQIIDYGMQQYR